MSFFLIHIVFKNDCDGCNGQERVCEKKKRQFMTDGGISLLGRETGKRRKKHENIKKRPKRCRETIAKRFCLDSTARVCMFRNDRIKTLKPRRLQMKFFFFFVQ